MMLSKSGFRSCPALIEEKKSAPLAVGVPGASSSNKLFSVGSSVVGVSSGLAEVGVEAGTVSSFEGNFFTASSTCLATSALEKPNSCTSSSFEFALKSVCRVFHAASPRADTVELQNSSSASFSPAAACSFSPLSTMLDSVTTL
jgi:hypothetical protein